MNYLVCVKQVPDDSVLVTLDADGSPDLKSIDLTVNAFDTYALEMITRVREKQGEGEITVLTVGGETAVSALRSCLSVGADKAARVWNAACEHTNAKAMSEILYQTISKQLEDGRKFDAILCGLESTDTMSGQVGARLAEKLGYALVTGAVSMEAFEDGFKVEQETENGSRVLKVERPCVITVSKPNYDPRYPTLKSKMAARKMPIEDWTLDSYQVAENAAARSFEVLPQKEGGQKIMEEDVACSVQKAIAIMVEDKVL